VGLRSWRSARAGRARYCLGLWVVALFAFGLVSAPRLTRFAATVLTALTASDFLQIAYKAAEEKGLG
jgi:hypothetical protein